MIILLVITASIEQVVTTSAIAITFKIQDSTSTKWKKKFYFETVTWPLWRKKSRLKRPLKVRWKRKRHQQRFYFTPFSAIFIVQAAALIILTVFWQDKLPACARNKKTLFRMGPRLFNRRRLIELPSGATLRRDWVRQWHSVNQYRANTEALLVRCIPNKVLHNLGRGGGIVVSVLDFCPDDPSSILANRNAFRLLYKKVYITTVSYHFKDANDLPERRMCPFQRMNHFIMFIYETIPL